MATDRSPKPVHYPESDGKPMAESDIHRDEMARLIYTLQDWLTDTVDVYVSGNMLLYYEEGNPRASVAPDVFVVKGVPKHRRRIYKLWEEGVPPAMAFEVTSPTTRRDDVATKRALYARIGVAEYYLYDPLAEYLHPAFQGYRLEDGEYRAIEPTEDGALVSEALGLRLMLVNDRLELFDQTTGKRLLSREERIGAEQARLTAAEARIAEMERLLRERANDHA
jgi:Uma2 family endonuclease